MNKLKAAAALLVLGLSAGNASFAETVYVPPSGERPRFGGEILLTEVGPVAGYWRSECRTWSIRSKARRGGPKAAAQLDQTFKRFVSGLIAKKPDYDDMSPAMAEAVRKNLDTYWPSINRMGRASVGNQFDRDEAGNTLYVVNQAGNETHWNVTVDPQGKIAGAFICEGGGL
jgi:hypothetical protein